jgi:hypothetical protein
MKRLLLIPIALTLTFCAGNTGTPTPAPVPAGQGNISIEVVPNPIVATQVNGDTYDFPFEVVVRETGGRDVEIERVTADVRAFGSLPVANESYDAAKIRSLGYATRVPANSTLRYKFAPRKSVPDERLFGGSISAELRADGHDDTGHTTTSSVGVTIRR